MKGWQRVPAAVISAETATLIACNKDGLDESDPFASDEIVMDKIASQVV